MMHKMLGITWVDPRKVSPTWFEDTMRKKR